MDRETVMRLAREAGLRTGGNGNYGVSHITEIERFAAAVEANCVAEFIGRFKRHVGGDGEFWLHELENFYDAPTPKEESTLICPRCKVDRFKEPCPGPMHLCPIKGEAQ